MTRTRARLVFPALLAFTFISTGALSAPPIHMPTGETSKPISGSVEILANPFAPVKKLAPEYQENNKTDDSAKLPPNAIIADSTIKAVTVYSDRAKVTRTATVEIPAGAHIVVFRGLPESLFADSLRAEGTAKAEVKFGAVTSKKTTGTELVMPRERELNDQLESLEDQYNLLRANKEALAQKKEFLASLGQQAKLRSDEEIAQIDLKPEQWSGAAQAIYTGISDILTADAQQDIKIRIISRQIHKIRTELKQLITGQKSTYDIMVPLESPAATSLTISLSYQVPNATWRPIYDARLSTEGQKLELVEYGSVRQKTGEDWKGAALTLSTAQPQRGASQPDLNPLWVDASTYQNPSIMMSPGAATRGKVGDVVSRTYQRALEESNKQTLEEALRKNKSVLPVPIGTPQGRVPITDPGQSTEDPLERWRRIQAEGGQFVPERTYESTFVAAQVDSGGFVSEYKIPGPATVLSDNTDSKLMVASFDTDSKIQVHIKPQLSNDAFLVSKTTLKGESPALPGRVNLFRDGAYVGQDDLPLLRPGEEHGLYFGIDDQVAVRRKVLKDEKGEAGLIAKENVLERNFVTELQNLHSKPVEVVVREVSPVGRNERIAIEVLPEATTPGYEKDTDNIKGQLQWTLPMTPKEKKDLKLGWKISWPKDMSLSGL
jgi:hypothetical protein